MAKRKPKPATAGEKIAKWYDGWVGGWVGCGGDTNLSRRIDRAIARAVRKERRRCLIIANVHREKWIRSSNEIRTGVKP